MSLVAKPVRTLEAANMSILLLVVPSPAAGCDGVAPSDNSILSLALTKSSPANMSTYVTGRGRCEADDDADDVY